MRISGRYILRFFAYSGVLFLLYRPLVPVYAALLVAPMVVAVEPLNWTQHGSRVTFEWQGATRSFQFTEVHFESLCANLVVLGALLLALERPWRTRLRKLAASMPVLYVINALHLAVLLLYSHRQALVASSEASAPAGAFWGVVIIAYHMAEQVGTMVVPFFVFLLLTLEQRPGAEPQAPAAIPPGPEREAGRTRLRKPR